MSIERPRTKKELIEHTKFRLGFPVVKINMDEMQFNVVMEEALDVWVEHAADAKEKFRMVVVLDDTNVLKSNVRLPDSVVFVENVLAGSNIGFANLLPGNQFWLVSSGLFGFMGVDTIGMSGSTQGASIAHTGHSMTEYAIMRQWLSTVNDMFDMSHVPFTFNRKTHILFSDRFASSSVGEKFLVMGWMRVDMLYDGQESDIWNDFILKEIYYYMCLKQWGRNLSKFDQITLPSGQTFNGTQMLDEAEQKLEGILERLKEEFSYSGGDILIG